MLHSDISTGDVHYIQNWSVADNTARDALTVTAVDVGKVCFVTGTQTFYILAVDSPMTWTELGGGGGTGDVVGPASATDNAIVRFDGTTGKLIQNSAATIADTTGDITAGKYNTVSIAGASTPALTVTGTTSVSGANTGDQNLFSTIAVSGQSNVVADSTSDTLTLVAGTNVTITTDASTDSITINASGGGGSGITVGTVTNLSGTATTITGIPNTAKRVTLKFSGASTNGTSGIGIKLGTSGGLESSGYTGGYGFVAAGGASNTGANSTYIILGGTGTSDSHYGYFTFELYESSTNTWGFSGSAWRSGAAIYPVGTKALSGALDRIGLISVNGTDTFDAGNMVITYE